MNLLGRERSVDHVDLAGDLHDHLLVEHVQLSEILEGHLRIPDLRAHFYVAPAIFGRLGQEYIQVWEPTMFFIKIFICFFMFYEVVRLGPLPEYPPRAHQGALVDSWSLGLECSKDRHLERKDALLGVGVKFSQRPLVQGFLEDPTAQFLEERELRRLARADIAIYDDPHCILRLPFFKAAVPSGTGAPHAALRRGKPSDATPPFWRSWRYR